MTLHVGEVSQHHDTNHTTDEILATGDGIETNFTGRSLHFPIVFGTVQIEFTISATTHQVTEAGGTFTHAQISAGTIDEDGNYDITFNSPLDDTTDLQILDYSTKGFLTKLLELISVAPTKEVVGAGTGAQLIFNFTLTGAGAIEPGNARLRWVFQGVEYDLWDDALGEWQHPLIASSSIDYGTRICNVTFDTGNAPDNSTNVDAWSVPAGESWVQVLEERTVTDTVGSAEPDADQQKEVILFNSGVSGQEEIIIGLREYSRISIDVFGLELALGRRWTYEDDDSQLFWDLSGAKVFPYATSYNVTYNVQNSSQKFIYSSDAMKYWVNVTKSRVHIIIRNTGTIFTSCSFGEGIRYASQSAYPKPQYVAGSVTSITTPFTSTLVYGVARPTTATWRIFDPNTEYKTNVTSGSTNALIVGYNLFVNTALLKRTTLNKVFVQRIHAVFTGQAANRQNTAQVFFSLDGLFICPDNDIDSEHTLNTTEYIAFQDVFRTTYQDYYCVTQS